MDRAPLAQPQPKVAAVQALRALAALAVATVHLTSGFARHIDRRLEGMPAGDQLAQAAVALFFVISGCVMVLSSRNLFGSPGGALRFWRRRAVRVLPPYWIATGLMVAALLAIGAPLDFGYVVRSMAFIGAPSGTAAGTPFVLFLWPGWSLAYELLFYALFGAFVALGRTRAVVMTALALGALVVAGVGVSPDRLAFLSATRPIVLLFVAGMAFGLVLEGEWVAPRWSRWLALVGAAAFFVAASPPEVPFGWAYLAWAGLPAALLFFAVVAGPWRLPFGDTIARLGDASYAIYLLHVPFAHLWMKVFNTWWGHPGGSIAYLVLGLVLLIALSLAFYRWVERPLTTRSNRLFGDRPTPSDLARTLAP